MQNLGFTRTRRSIKLTANVSARDLEVRSRLAFILDHERSFSRFEIARHIDLTVVDGHVYSSCIGVGSERVPYFVGCLLHALANSLSSLLGFLRRRVGNILCGVEW